MVCLKKHCLTAALVLVLCLAFATFLGNAEAEGAIDTGKEYASGTIPVAGAGIGGLNVWYTWINTSGTQVAYLAYHSEVYNSPLVMFLAQRYQTTNGTEVFVGNTLLLMEAYTDSNGNGIPEADFAAGKSEVKYFFQVNSSKQFVGTPVQRTTVGGIPHYTWEVRYSWVDGFLLFPENQVVGGVSTNLAARVNLSYLGFSFDYYVQAGVSHLKVGFQLGEVVDFALDAPGVVLDGLGLSLLYGTATAIGEPYVVLVDGNPYNSTRADRATMSAGRVEIDIGDVKTYEFLFEENYTLYKDSKAETHRSMSAASTAGSVPPEACGILNWILSWLPAHLSEELFSRMIQGLSKVDLDYRDSAFLYRVCYPVWEGRRIDHDPRYIAYLGSAIPELPIVPVSVMLLCLALLTKTRAKEG